MREVTERDFRAPEFRDAKVEDYEFRGDGKIVRKDRWEMGIQRIRELVNINAREFEIPEVVQAVEAHFRPTPVHLTIWTSEDGPVTWWCYSERDGEWLTAVPWVGQPTDPDWPGHHTHFTPLPRAPKDPQG